MAGNRGHTTEPLEQDLLNNGLDFIRKSLESLALLGRSTNETARAYKYTLLQMFTGTLLILKERLRRENPSLIFQGSPKPGPSAPTHTVNFDDAIK